MNAPRSTPRTVSALFPSKWLTAADLQKPTTVTITDAMVEEVRQADGAKELKLVLSFKNASKRMILNLTQARRLAELLGTEEFAAWVGCRATLAKGVAQNGRDTIVVTQAFKMPAEVPETPAAASNPRDQAAAAGMTDEEAAAMWQTNGGSDGGA